MSMNVAKILLDPTSSQKQINRVLNLNNMQIVKKFSPVISEYKLQLNPTTRRIYRLTDDEFIAREERLRSGNWKMAFEMRSTGTLEKLEDEMIMAINNLKEYLAGHPKKYINIK